MIKKLTVSTSLKSPTTSFRCLLFSIAANGPGLATAAGERKPVQSADSTAADGPSETRTIPPRVAFLGANCFSSGNLLGFEQRGKFIDIVDPRARYCAYIILYHLISAYICLFVRLLISEPRPKRVEMDFSPRRHQTSFADLEKRVRSADLGRFFFEGWYILLHYSIVVFVVPCHEQFFYEYFSCRHVLFGKLSEIPIKDKKH